ncbi:MAG: GTPase HflX [Oscillospiraceae bacterium]|nr:GTPase HflX [Oscillospiraceae bacterium]
MFENEQNPQTALLVAVDTGEYDAQASLDELAELAATAGAEVVGRMCQKRPSIDTATCVGAGRLEEIALFAQNGDVDLLIFDHELTASQLRNIEEATQTAVVDRTMLILDIFAQRARSGEGKLQVELAQLRYRLPRLMGQGRSLSRLGGGIGTRGPGESKLESDRRHIRRRIEALEEQLRDLTRRRAQQRSRRKKDGILSVAIVGYTNVGKSTLLNALTDAGVLAEDKLFATLDPTARALELPDGRSVMLVDTVGLIRRLPHHLVEAFKSTLEEAAQADLILNVCDVSSPDMDEQVRVTRELLESLGAGGTPVVTVLNKCDLLAEEPLAMDRRSVLVSARTGKGFDRLLEAVSRELAQTQVRLRLLLPYGQGALSAEIREEGRVFSEEYTAEGILIDALVEKRILYKVLPYRADTGGSAGEDT